VGGGSSISFLAMGMHALNHSGCTPMRLLSADEIPPRTLAEVRADMLRFIKVGVRYATYLTLYVAAMALITRGENLAALGVPWWVLLILYYSTAVIGGVIVGAFDPARLTRRRALLVGFLVLLLPLFMLSWTLHPVWDIRWRILTSVAGAAVMGPIYAWMLWPNRVMSRRTFSPPN
jgi:hypothetical protein